MKRATLLAAIACGIFLLMTFYSFCQVIGNFSFLSNPIESFIFSILPLIGWSLLGWFFLTLYNKKSHKK